MKNLGSIMKQAQKMQAQIAKVQEELAQKTIEASAGGGMVTVVANGKQEIISIKIEPEVVDPKVKITCLACPPDAHPSQFWCEWQFDI